MKTIKIYSIIFLIFGCVSGYGQNGWIQVYESGSLSLELAQIERLNKIQGRPFHTENLIVSVGAIEDFQQQNKIFFDLPGKDCTVEAKVTRLSYQDSDNYSWSGAVVSDEEEDCSCHDGSISLVRTNGEYFAHFSIDEEDFTLNDLGGGKQVLSKIDFGVDDVPFCGSNGGGQTEEVSDDGDVNSRGDENCPVTVLVLYNAGALTHLNNPTATAMLEIEKTNAAFQRSRVGFELQLAGVDSIGFELDVDPEFDVAALAMDSLANVLRDQYNADLVVLFGNGGYSTTLGIVAAIGPNEANAYALVQAYATDGTFVFPHEVGHLFGCRHECKADNTGPIEHAHRLKLGCFDRKRTIMWSNAGKKIIQNYSNPEVTYYNKPTGVWGERHNASKLNTTNCTVAFFRDSTYTSTLSAYLKGPYAICLGEDVPMSAIVTGGALGNYNFSWSYSYDGFNYTDLNSNNFSVGIPGINLPPIATGSYPIYIKVTITDANGTSINLFRTVEATNNDVGQDTPCSHYPRPLIGSGTNSVHNSIPYPNPVHDILYLNGVQENSWVEVVGLDGRVIIQSESTDSKSQINVSDLPNGLYYLRMEGQDEIFKFTKF